jgi:hypothetical protein
MFLIYFSSYEYLHDKFYYVCQASFCIVSRLQTPDELLVQQENFDTDLFDNVDIGPLNEEINFSITQEEILRCIKKLTNNKACGEDYAVNEYIKSTSDLFLPTYEKIFKILLLYKKFIWSFIQVFEKLE